ncbi:GIY-YIG nuclease family protein [Brevibacillus sp. SYP-B805]|uniref:GIY-YIG nuclease family protein n=1 Tax=Brevibacillus sp. SYP-B805 TaxID=1578199 RepID=UPI0013EAC3A2|nr:GIY-YIG nuclease family protein [Brevibacillus sp. SYP-B805]NGQ97341.1 GIY-YIG nuclease family protein [Brevibacillus sp. SYP-B805]
MDRRSEIKKIYKQTHQPMGVYQIKNLRNGKRFVGSSPNLPARFNSMLFQLRHGVHRNRSLQAEWNEYGEEAFAFEILEEIKPQEAVPYQRSYAEELQELEEKWLRQLQPYGEHGYNRVVMK